MSKKNLYTVCVLLMLLFSCSKKIHPSRTENNVPIVKTDSVAKKTVKPKPKEPIPKVIVVNDKAAHQSIDGRYYYDLLGHRYWKNFKDGKYYLFNKSMYNNNNFKAPGK